MPGGELHMKDTNGSFRALSELSPEEALFREEVRRFAAEEVAPLARPMDEEGLLRQDLLEKLFAFGLMGIEIPETFGGQEGSFFQTILAIEQLAEADPSIAVVVDVQNTLVNNAIRRWGSPEQKARYLPRLAADMVGAFSLSEAGAGSDAFALACRAEQLAGGDYLLTGQKLWVTNAAEAGLFLVFANQNPAEGYRGITCFVVERRAPGFHVGKKENKLGIRASSTCELILDNCRIGPGQVLGNPGQGYKIAMETLNEGRIGIGAQMVGLAQAALGHAVSYSLQRKQFGKLIGDFQGVQFQLAEMAAKLEAARLLVYNAARLRDAGKPVQTEAAIAKLFSSQVAEEIASTSIEILGGLGFTKECPVEKLYRDAKIGRIYEGTSNMQRLTIAKHLLGKQSGGGKRPPNKGV
jgi:butyryl-CoA dehydrogenase/short/branched chain acyl-CoA dehydrogenase